MKYRLFAAALILGTPALAQDMATQPAPMSKPPGDAATMPTDPAQSSPPADGGMATPPADSSMTVPAADPMAQQPMGQQPMAQPPMADPAMGNAGAMTPQPSTKEYPMCSRTVTDSCTNGPPRARARARGRR